MTTARLTLPWPPSMNTYWRHVGARVLISRAGREYRQAVALLARRSGIRLGSARLRVWFRVAPPDARRRDLDNLGKALLDAMCHAGMYDDDSQVDDLRFIRHQSVKPGIVVAEASVLEEELPVLENVQ